MTFDAEISVFSAVVATTSPEQIEDGAQPHLELGIMTGTALPIMNPQTGEPILVPIGQFRFAFSKKQAVEVFSKALAAAQSLPDTSSGEGKVVVAHSMTEVEQAAKALKVVQR